MALAMAAMLLPVLLWLCSFVAVEGLANSTSGFPVPSYYVLGDSFMDAGNNNHIPNQAPKANFKPYGITYFKGKSSGRFCDGRIFPDLLAVIMKLPQAVPSTPPPTIAQKGQCVNYASGGSAILKASSDAVGWNKAITLENQMTMYETHAVDVIYEFGVDDALLILNDAIYQFSFGTVDILAYFLNPSYAVSVGSINTFINTLAREYLYYVNRVYGQGARKVVIFGLGPIQKYPFTKLLGSKMTRNASAKFHLDVDRAVRQLNKKLLEMVNYINADSDQGMEHESLRLVYADVYGAVNDIIASPSKHGFTNVRTTCCGGGLYGAETKCGANGYKVCANLGSTFFWDDLHYTEAGNKRLFKLFFDGSSFVKPFSVKHMAKLLIPGVPY